MRWAGREEGRFKLPHLMFMAAYKGSNWYASFPLHPSHVFDHRDPQWRGGAVGIRLVRDAA